MRRPLHVGSGVARSGSGRATVFAAVLALSIGAAACGGDSESTGDAKAKTDTNEVLSGRALVAKVQPSMVSIVSIPPGVTREPADGGRHAHGTGVIYDAKRGLVLTSNHYLENAASIRVTVNGKTPVRGRPVARAQCKDFAVVELRPRPSNLTEIRFGDSDKVVAGDQVTAMGYLQPPGQKKASFIKTDGTVSSTDVSSELHPDLPALPSVTLHQAPLQLAMSGGPLVNDRGEMVGLDSLVRDGSVPDSGPWPAVTGNWLKEWLAQLRPGKGSTYVGWKSEHRCHGALAELSRAAEVEHPPGAKPGQHPSGRKAGQHPR
jgi:S1-C subfamily serine protease